MPSTRLKRFLDERGVRYEIIRHSPAYTARELAQKTHVAGDEIAKTVVLRSNEGFVMVTLPATRQVDLDKAEDVVERTGPLRLATEVELRGLFPECEVGAMPPFGNLYDMPVVVDERLADDEFIVFNAGSHSEAVRMPFTEFRRLVEPVVARVSARDEVAPAW